MSNPLRRMFRTDKTAEVCGAVVKYAEGVEIKIARAGGSNTRFSQLLARLTKQYRRQIQTETIEEDVLKKILYEVYAKTVVMDWTGFTKDLLTGNDKDADTPLPFNVSNCVAVFTEMPDLFAEIVEYSKNLSLFRELEREEDTKN